MSEQEAQRSVEAIEQAVFEEIGEETTLALYEQMLLMRRFEEQAGRVYQMGGKIKGFCHLYIGQEAVASGSMHTLTPDDYVISAYREHAQAIAKGVDPDAIMAELFAKSTGTSQGMGGSMHIFDVDKKFYGGWGIVGGHVPTATGIGFAIKYRQEDACCLCYFGDGSIHQGAFHESLNMAKLWELPVVYIIENNGYGMGTSLERASAITELSRKADGYGMAGDTFDGQNIFVVIDGVKRAVERAKKQSLPSLLDIRTYRFRGHSMSDPATYRSKDELDSEKQRDPIQHLHNFIVDKGVKSDDDLKALDKQIKTSVKESIKKAEAADFADVSKMYDYAYVDWSWEHEGRS